MDLTLTAQLLGNFGEFSGAIAVVLTLGYLALQIRQNTRSVRASSFQSGVDGINHLNICRLSRRLFLARSRRSWRCQRPRAFDPNAHSLRFGGAGPPFGFFRLQVCHYLDPPRFLS